MKLLRGALSALQEVYIMHEAAMGSGIGAGTPGRQMTTSYSNHLARPKQRRKIYHEYRTGARRRWYWLIFTHHSFFALYIWPRRNGKQVRCCLRRHILQLYGKHPHFTNFPSHVLVMVLLEALLHSLHEPLFKPRTRVAEGPKGFRVPHTTIASYSI